MNFEKLLEPYAERDQHGNKTRTVEGQIKWLMGKGIPRNIIDQAILQMFQELQNGLSFENTAEAKAGHHLDQHLLNIAKNLHQEDLGKQARELEKFLNMFKQNAVEEYVKTQQSSVWKRMKAVFKPL